MVACSIGLFVERLLSMSPEEKGFEVKDRRLRETDDTEASPGTGERRAQSDARAKSDRPPRGPLTFSEFIFSLSASTLVHLGAEPDPQTGERRINLPQASELIDLITLLEEKTRGNLSADESAFLSNVLYMLRMKFVETAKQQPRQPEG